ncbi:hypothetical protein LX69_00344 [Breznakibacter xylanolyticus]|uniref:Uncharacterized protein n=1 Tax=Breznakibacter xylanolyticus TaxID=990 RepID=A0A2W7NQK0_9BACT|nr:hypothetical protein [Breznakibacter xylanolyticus]PZX20347.1 hypothetical protein LX69_00344 [Breznakibacter xylanolyticus]
MKKKRFKPLWIAFVSLTLTGAGYLGYVQACAWFEPQNWYASMFAPQMIAEKGKDPLYRSMLQFYDIQMVENNIDLFTDTNVKEWQKFFNQQVKPSDISYLLYQASTGEIDTAIFYIKSRNYPLTPRLMLNSLMKYPNATDAKDFLYYAGYARRCEPYVTYDANQWYYGDSDQSWRTDPSAMQTQIEGGLKMMGLVQNDFIRERYLFQVIRLRFMQGDYRGCIDTYMTHKAVIKTGNTIQYRIIGYLAGAYLRTGHTAKANHLYSVVYDRCQPLRLSAYMSFAPADESDWQETLALARNNREKCVLWQITGVKHDPFRALTEIAAIDPTSDQMDLLLVRLINMAEERFLCEISDYYGQQPVDQGDYTLANGKIAPEALQLILKMAQAGNTANPLLWKLAAGYLTLVSGQYDQANAWLAQVSSAPQASPLMKQQARLLKLVNDIDRATLPDAAFEARITPELKWLHDAPQEGELRSSYAFAWCLYRLAQKHLAAGNAVKAHVLNRYTNPRFYLESDNCDRMLAYMNGQRTDFERFTLSIYPYTQKQIVQHQAVQLFYDNRLADALRKLDQVPGAGAFDLLGDPFRIRINDCHDCDHADTSPLYTQRTFIEKMLEYQTIMTQNPDRVADCSFKLANGFYNATYFGNARYFYQTDLVDWGYFSYWTGDFGNMNAKILDCTQAMKYYHKAMEASKNPEFKAKCCFMAAKCEQNIRYMRNELGEHEDFRSGKYFRMMKKEFANTDYYNDVIQECKYFRTFANQ